jgi:hypothetical protein
MIANNKAFLRYIFLFVYILQSLDEIMKLELVKDLDAKAVTQVNTCIYI